MKLDAPNTRQYLIQRGLIPESALTEVILLSGGVSCTGFYVNVPAGKSLVIKQALPQLLVKSEWRADPARSHVEALLLTLLRDHLGGQHVPRLILEDQANHIVVMEAAPSEAENWKHQLMAGVLDRGVARQVGELLGRIQNLPVSDLPVELFDKTYFKQLRVDAYLMHVASSFPRFRTALQSLANDFMSAADCLVHGDYTPKNILVSGATAILLDYEVGHMGHPAFDTASIVNHFYLKRIRMPQLAADFIDLTDSFLQGYMSIMGGLPDRFFEALGSLMVARVLGKSPVEYLDAGGQEMALDVGSNLLAGAGIEVLK